MKKNIESIIDSFIVDGVRYGFAKPYFQSVRRQSLNIKTAIVFIFSYPVLTPPTNISNYARIPDYHPAVLSYLNTIAQKLYKVFPDNSFECFVDTYDFDEVSMAASAGLGVIGNNRLLISKEFGSYLFIGEIACDIEIECEDKTKLCLGCGSCQQKCYGAIGESFCKDKCLSFFSQSKGELSPFQQDIIKRSGMVWGCDRCQIYCPLNIDKTDEVYKPFSINIFDSLTKDNIATAKDRAFFWRGEQPLLRNLDILEGKDD